MQPVDLQTLNWIIYCRKSTDSEDKQVQSLPAQVKELKEMADHMGLVNIVKIYQESCSAFHPGRPDFNDMMAKLYAGEANAVLTWAGNRIARNAVDAGAFVYGMDQGKILVIKTSGGTYFNTPDNKFSLNIDFTVSKKSSDDLSEAVHRGNRIKFFDNKEWGAPAKQGFINYIDPVTRKREVAHDKERFDILQQAGKHLVSGKFTPVEALEWLNDDMGYRTLQQRKKGGGPLAKTTYYNFLSDPFYYGVMCKTLQGVYHEVEHKYKKMFTKDEWDIIQIRLGVGRRRSRQLQHDFPFKGVMTCGECDGFVTAEEKWQIICPECKTKFAKTRKRAACIKCGLKIESMKKPTILHYTYYHCTKKINKKCNQGFLELRELNRQVDLEIERFEIDPDFKDWAIAHLAELNEKECQQDKKATTRNTGNYDVLKAKLRRMTRHRFSDTYEDSSSEEKEAYEEELASLKDQIESTKENIQVTDEKQYDWIDLSKKIFDFACYARYWFHHGDTKTRTQVLQLLGSNLKLYNKKVVIDGDNLWWLIEKAKKDMKEIGISVEPTKKAGHSSISACYDPAIPILLRD